MTDLDQNTAKPLGPGSIIADRFEIERLLGEGGFAKVYKAHQLSLDQPVAIKILHSIEGARRPAFNARFKREAYTTSRIRHPNVMKVLDCGELPDGDLFIAMEYLEGHDLEEELEHFGPLAPERARALILPCLDALSMAHRENIVHRDLKPSNLFLCHPRQRWENLRIVDFGIAFVYSEIPSTRLTLSGGILGTPRYLSPEYIEHREITPAMDVYQMGLILVEMLTGKPVVDSEDIYACFRTHCEGPITIPEVIKRSALWPVIAQAIARDPRERFADAGELRVALERIEPSLWQLDHAPIDTLDPIPDPGLCTTAPEPVPEPVPEPDLLAPTARAPWVYAAAAGLLAVVGVAWWASGDNANGGEPSPAVAPIVAEQPEQLPEQPEQLPTAFEGAALTVDSALESALSSLPTQAPEPEAPPAAQSDEPTAALDPEGDDAEETPPTTDTTASSPPRRVVRTRPEPKETAPKPDRAPKDTKSSWGGFMEDTTDHRDK